MLQVPVQVSPSALWEEQSKVPLPTVGVSKHTAAAAAERTAAGTPGRTASVQKMKVCTEGVYLVANFAPTVAHRLLDMNLLSGLLAWHADTL